MAKLTVWNPWRISPRDLFDIDEEWGFGGMESVDTNLYEHGDNIIVEMKAPGFNKEDLDINIESGKVTVSGKSSQDTTEGEKDKKYYRREIRNMSFTRTVDLPVHVKSDEAKASFKNGILKITLPKSEEAKPKKISVEGEE